ncbi:MAG: bifunctional alpha/beta hydrolase/class I SAM-dependent methyltransferase [Ahniella sp.]|nr:bifunctional alpha/beta hydrolase/class I SAM-dependent methyltransferase [Ahniella sp.]
MQTTLESTFQTHDGLALFYRARTQKSARGAIVLLHRGHEHSARMFHLADELGLDDFSFFAYDARGLGRSPGTRGDAPGFSTLARDLDTFITHLETAHGIAPADVVVVAQSVGAVVATTWAHDYAPKIRGLVLASPAFSVKLYVPFARQGLALMHKLFGNFFVNSYVKAQFLTHDVERIKSYEQDPLITRPISVRILLGLYEAADRVVSDAQAITLPVQLLVSGADWVVRHEPQHSFFDRLPHPRKQKLVFPRFYHDTLGEKDRAPAVKAIHDFIEGLFSDAPERLNRLDAHERGATFDEAQALARPLPWYSPRAWYWAATRASLKFGALLSKGLALGQKTGFDSGSTLDYVYCNQAQGVPLVGTLIDRTYLDSIGWRGIRLRKQNLQELLVLAAARLRTAGKPVHIMDIAAGHGRYVVDASGLYELFPDNDQVGRSLAGMADAIESGGFLVYTGQPWHPQLELIARALTSHRQGAAWVMRRRTQAEMDQLVETAGFRKIAQRVDPFGIFTVSLAVRR